jgi:hypothetical protein
VKITRIIMVVSSLVLGIAGAGLLFAPLEALSTLGFEQTNELTGQLLGALYLAFAAANWTARGGMVGGVYARPLSIANFVHFLVGAIVLARGLATDTPEAGHVLVTAAYLAFAVLFILMLYGRLLPAAQPPPHQE